MQAARSPRHTSLRVIPRVTVIVPAYGVAHLLAAALHSLQQQSLSNWECIVIDDGAPDDVAAAVAPFLIDSRIRFLATSNHGVSAARNTAIRNSRAPLIALLDGDDLFRPEYLASTVALLESDPTIRLVTCNARIFGAVPKERPCVITKQGSGDGLTGTLADVLDRSFNVYIGTTFRRADFDAIGGFDESMAQSEDFDLWVRLMMLGGTARYIDSILGDYRVRPGSASAIAERILRGNLKVYTKALTSLGPNHPEAALLHRLIEQQQAALAFEHAIDRVIDGDTRSGLDDLANCGHVVDSQVWRLAASSWQLFPMLARPMLIWRRASHARGGAGHSLKNLIQAKAS